MWDAHDSRYGWPRKIKEILRVVFPTFGLEPECWGHVDRGVRRKWVKLGYESGRSCKQAEISEEIS